MPAFVSLRNGPFRDVSRPRVRRWADRMLRALDLARAELSVAMTDDGEIRELNHVFRHKDRPTDVLAFAMREGEPIGVAPKTRGTKRARTATEILGDVVISVETARRQAKERRRPLDAEVRMLLAHGLLHLVGYDHRTDREEAIMTAETERLCKAALAMRKAPRARKTGAARSPARKTAGRVRSSGSKSGTSKRAASRKVVR